MKKNQCIWTKPNLILYHQLEDRCYLSSSEELDTLRGTTKFGEIYIVRMVALRP